MVEVVILAGGSGTRLWPLSSARRTKQFLPLPGKKTLIEQTVERARKITSSNHIWIITVQDQVKQTLKTLKNFPKNRIIAEPMGRNTAPAACFATLFLQAKRGVPTTVLLLPADHFIPDKDIFARTMKKGVNRASQGKSLVTFGLKIQAPRSDFGYIKVKRNGKTQAVRKALQFIEKPPLSKAQIYACSKNYFWNSGMFAWRSDFFLKSMEQHASKTIRKFKNLNFLSSSFSTKLKKIYPQLSSTSIDYALMEKSSHVEVVPARFAWSDLGTWAQVYESLARKKTQNVILGHGQAVSGKGNMIRSFQKPVVLFGVNNLVVVDTPEATLVTTKEKSRDLKSLLQTLKQ